METNQEDSSNIVEIKTTSTSTTTVNGKSEDVNPEAMSREDLYNEIEKIAAGKSCFWSDQGKEAWLRRLEARAIALNTVEILQKLQAIRVERS